MRACLNCEALGSPLNIYGTTSVIYMNEWKGYFMCVQRLLFRDNSQQNQSSEVQTRPDDPLKLTSSIYTYVLPSSNRHTGRQAA